MASQAGVQMTTIKHISDEALSITAFPRRFIPGAVSLPRGFVPRGRRIAGAHGRRFDRLRSGAGGHCEGHEKSHRRRSEPGFAVCLPRTLSNNAFNVIARVRG